jgi:DNA polymerase epsilon subunit 2
MPGAQVRTLNKKLSQIFRLRGLSVRPDAMQPLYDILQGDESWETTLQALLVEVQQQQLKNGNVDAKAIRAAIGNLRTRAAHKPTLPLEVIGAFNMQPIRFDNQRRTLTAEPGPTSLHAEAASKSSMYTLRMQMVEQRTRRHEMFRPPVTTQAVAQKEYISLTSIDALLGRTGTHVVLGLLTESEEGVFSLEDGHSSIQLDLSDAALTNGLFTRHSIVLAEGEVMPNGTFAVRQLGMPPPELRARSTASLGNLDPLRPTHSGSPSSVLALPAASAPADAASGVAAQNAMLVVLSDVHLDEPAVLAQLGRLFAGYEQVGAGQVGSGRTAVPLATFFTFVLCGNFTSAAHAAATAHAADLRSLFDNLAALLAKTPLLARHAHFVFVPGPDDATLGGVDVLPRASLPRSLCGELVDGLSHAHLTTSPARLILCGQTVVVHREEVLVKARRACVLPPPADADEALNEHLLKTLVDQAHLCPLPPAEAAVYWQYDHALWLHPAPDVLILADRQHQFQHTYEETLAFNPGAFAADFAWMVYRPSNRQVEASSLE